MNAIISVFVYIFSFFADLVKYLAKDCFSLFFNNNVFFLSFFGGAAMMGIFFLFVNLKRNGLAGFFKNFFKEYYLFFSLVTITILFLIAVSADDTLTFKKEESYSLEKEKSAIQNEMVSRADKVAKEYEAKLSENNNKNQKEKDAAATETEQLEKDIQNLKFANQENSDECQKLVTQLTSFTAPAENSGIIVVPPVTAVFAPAQGYDEELAKN